MSVFIPQDTSQALVSHNHLTLSTVAVHLFTFRRASIQHDSGPHAGIERLGRREEEMNHVVTPGETGGERRWGQAG